MGPKESNQTNKKLLAVLSADLLWQPILLCTSHNQPQEQSSILFAYKLNENCCALEYRHRQQFDKKYWQGMGQPSFGWKPVFLFFALETFLKKLLPDLIQQWGCVTRSHNICCNLSPLET